MPPRFALKRISGHKNTGNRTTTLGNRAIIEQEFIYGGIIGYVGSQAAIDILIDGLSNMNIVVMILRGRSFPERRIEVLKSKDSHNLTEKFSKENRLPAAAASDTPAGPPTGALGYQFPSAQRQKAHAGT
jgi:hypothetical protein